MPRPWPTCRCAQPKASSWAPWATCRPSRCVVKRWTRAATSFRSAPCCTRWSREWRLSGSAAPPTRSARFSARCRRRRASRTWPPARSCSEYCASAWPRIRTAGIKACVISPSTCASFESRSRARRRCRGRSEPARESATARWRRRPVWIGTAVVAAAIAAAILWPVRRGSEPPPTAPGGATARPAVAVVAFEVIGASPDVTWLGKGLPSMLITGLAQTPDIEVVGNERLGDAARQIGASTLDGVERSKLAELARRAGARFILNGTIVQAGPDIRIDARVEDLVDWGRPRGGDRAWARRAGPGRRPVGPRPARTGREDSARHGAQGGGCGLRVGRGVSCVHRWRRGAGERTERRRQTALRGGRSPGP